MQRFLYLLIILPSLVLAYPDGAPLDACQTRAPSNYSKHAFDKGTWYGPQKFFNHSYELKVSGEMAMIDMGPVKVNFTVNRFDDFFRGILLHAVDARNMTIGRFEVPIEMRTNFKDTCGGKAVTHTNRNDKRDFWVNWFALREDGYQGPVYFRATVVKTLHVWWITSIQTNTIQVVMGGAPPISAGTSVILYSGLLMVLAYITAATFVRN